VDSLKAELDELMGRERNIPLQERRKYREHYNEDTVCKYALVTVCPHDLFPNTKCDLGKCNKRHEDYFRFDFERDPNRHQYEKKYIQDAINLFDSLVSQVDAKVKKTITKQDEFSARLEQNPEIQEKVEAIDNEIKKKLSEAEQFGDGGQIEESEICMAQVEALKKRREELKLSGDLNSTVGQMKICEVCGGMQTTTDLDRRAQMHYEGKIHTGFAILRRELEVLKKKREELKTMTAILRKDD